MENEANKKYLSVPKKIAYGSGDFGSNFFYMLVSSFMMLYLTDSVGLNAGVVGTPKRAALKAPRLWKSCG